VEKRRIGSLEVSAVGLGCNNFGRRIDADASAGVVRAALDAGIDFFDTADVYGAGESETFLGRALGERRRDVAIATKFGFEVAGEGGGAAPDYVRRAAEASLRRLGTDYIDLYQLHKPDPHVPIADTLGALNELVGEGKVREIGCSNFSAEQLREAEAAVGAGAARFVSVQNEYSLLHREPEEGVLEACSELDLALLPYFPLKSGLLTGKYRKGRAAPEGARITGSERFADLLSEDSLDTVERLIAFAEGRGHTILELAFSWLLAHRQVASVIAGATRPEQVRANADAGGWALSEDERDEVDRILSIAA
jgi:aryl-alcohol dehydrogenase-like predicted oxidoreductase